MAKATDERSTPIDFFLQLDKRYHFDLDVCATKANAKCDLYFGPGSFIPDAFAPEVHWPDYGQMAWCNPPYSEIPRWLSHGAAFAGSVTGFRIVYLLPSNTSARWWHSFVWDAERGCWRPNVRCVVFHDKRLVFAPHTDSAMWPSVVVEFGNERGGKRGKFQAKHRR
jgi:site-specific DNA-methyltransferase (adenine-specific)